MAESITKSVSSLVWAAAGLQLKLPVITVLLSTTANLWCSLSPRARRGVPTPVVAVVLKDLLRDAQVSHGSIARTQARWALDLVLSPHRAKKGYWINGWLGF